MNTLSNFYLIDQILFILKLKTSSTPLTNADLVIVDKYNYTDGYYEEIQAENTIIFDDIEFIVPSRVNGVINLQAYANQSRYSSIKAFLRS